MAPGAARLDDVGAEFTRVTDKELSSLNQALKAKGVQPLAVPSPAAFEDGEPRGARRPGSTRTGLASPACRQT